MCNRETIDVVSERADCTQIYGSGTVEQFVKWSENRRRNENSLLVVMIPLLTPIRVDVMEYAPLGGSP
jgi:hypothetical protein